MTPDYELILDYVYMHKEYFNLRAMYREVHKYLDKTITTPEFDNYINILVDKGLVLKYTTNNSRASPIYIYNFMEYRR